MFIGYVRVSTDDKGQTVDNQIYTIKQRQAVSIFITDEGVSGTTHPSKRPGLSKLLSLAKAGDTIVVTAYDRLSRNTRDFLEMLDTFKEQGITIISLRENIDSSTAAGRAMASFIMVGAQLERDNISERTKQALQRLKSEGKQLGRPKNTIHQERIQELKQAGMSVSEIAKELSISRPTVYKALK
ncbi:recombinase family protein [Escherichia coli]